MNRFAAEHPDDFEERQEAWLAGADYLRKRQREDALVEADAEERHQKLHWHYQFPERWGDAASPRRMAREVQREREEDDAA